MTVLKFKLYCIKNFYKKHTNDKLRIFYNGFDRTNSNGLNIKNSFK